MECRGLRHDRQMVSLLTDHTVFSPKYRGKILVGDAAFAVEGTIRKICKEMEIEAIDMAVNTDHIRLFIKYLSKYSVSCIAKRIKVGQAENYAKHFHISSNCVAKVSGRHHVSMDRSGMDGKVA